MTLQEWRELPRASVDRLYQREWHRWAVDLGWDTSSAWASVETARASASLPGVVCCDDHGRQRGWMFYLPRDGRLQAGGLVADNPRTTRMLLDRLLRDAAAQRRGCDGFVYATAPDLERALDERNLRRESHWYLTRSTAHVDQQPLGHDVACRAWASEDLPATAMLLQQAYGSAGQLFAPHGSGDEWTGYVRQLLAYNGCGVLQPALSRVLTEDGRAYAVTLVTTLSRGTAHLAQLAVHPSKRRGGIARWLVQESLRAAAENGHSHLSLLVAQSNHPASRLYRECGFTAHRRFCSWTSS